MNVITRTTSKAYAAEAVRAYGLLDVIQASLTAKGDCRTKEWEGVADLAHVNELLGQVAEFLCTPAKETK